MSTAGHTGMPVGTEATNAALAMDAETGSIEGAEAGTGAAAAESIEGTEGTDGATLADATAGAS